MSTEALTQFTVSLFALTVSPNHHRVVNHMTSGLNPGLGTAGSPHKHYDYPNVIYISPELSPSLLWLKLIGGLVTLCSDLYP